ncbi:NYN domain-containing protein [Dechloromonas sp. TW-R-39-2]|uniref:NYN domain-containing protein n=1 Tax=Dechloromonas sp. TW-R-39-2 TaxID=2654218 RepID=UPI00193D963A|nr:NYN domain-containing protein [Dechloromonas sp. TW-R-39-2]QRM19034.1 NYN domain-containing protein [Dechloromonas sp. TW-R-39-2]
MAAPADTASMALFCDFENVALGVRDAQYEKFDIKPVLERLLAKGSIVVKKAYCDWDRYKAFKSAMHEANFELIEIPHVRQSGKNSADIRLVVDALDLCYTKSHVDTFVIISGDSDFSPLVSKLRENAKRVIGVGVKQSCSDLLIANCDEFIYYDDLVRDRPASRRENREPSPRRTPEEENGRREKLEARKNKAIELATTTFADLFADRGDTERIWASVLKEVIKRRNPGFNENYYGFRSFGNLLEEAANRGLLGFGRDDKSGAYVTRAQPRPVVVENEAAKPESALEVAAVDVLVEPKMEPAAESGTSGNARRRGGRRTRKDGDTRAARPLDPVAPVSPVVEPVLQPEAAPAAAEEVPPAASRRRGGRRNGKKEPESRLTATDSASPAESPVVAVAPVEETVPAKAPARRGVRRSRKPAGEESAPVQEVAAAVVEVVAPKPKRAPRARKPKAVSE